MPESTTIERRSDLDNTMLDKVKVWGPFIGSIGSVLWAINTMLRCAQENEGYQQAIQALAEVAFK